MSVRPLLYYAPNSFTERSFSKAEKLARRHPAKGSWLINRAATVIRRIGLMSGDLRCRRCPDPRSSLAHKFPTPLLLAWKGRPQNAHHLANLPLDALPSMPPRQPYLPPHQRRSEAASSDGSPAPRSLADVQGSPYWQVHHSSSGRAPIYAIIHFSPSNGRCYWALPLRLLS